MPARKFLDIQRLYCTQGLTALSRAEVTYLLKQHERAELILEKISRLGYKDMREMVAAVQRYLREREDEHGR